MKNAAKPAQKDHRTNENRTEVHAEEFIPYACHYDPHTILTKNGELMQVIKVTGFAFESVHKSDTEILTLRAAIRQAVQKSIHTNNFSLWFHTIRRKRNLATGGEYPPGFADELNRAWCARHDWEHKYINELYISVLIEGESLSLKDIKTFFRSLYYPVEFRYRSVLLERAARRLHSATDGMLAVLQEYGAKKLGLFMDDGVYYSELLSFLGKLVNLKEVPLAVIPMDASEQLPSHQTSFGFNVLEVKGETGRHFGAVLTVKEYHEVSTRYIDEFLQLPAQFIITETFDFVNQEQTLQYFENIYHLQTLSDDHAITAASGIDDIMKSNASSPVDFGEHQITILILEDSIPLLDKEIAQVIGALSNLGVMTVREDIFMEDCYWAQLPGNFEFLKRLTPINTKKVGGYASLYGFPAGKLANNPWGPAVTVFYTNANTPYFFNFHYGDNGHALVVGPYGSGKTVMLNFLLSEAQKFSPRLFLLDQQSGSEIFIRALAGSYHKITREPREDAPRLNPLLLSDTPENRDFLHEWFACLILDDISTISEDAREKIRDAVNYTFVLAPEERRLSAIIPKFWPLSHQPQKKEAQPAAEEVLPTLDIETLLTGNIDGTPAKKEDAPEIFASPEEKLALWCVEGKYAHIFDHAQDMLDAPEARIYGFDLTHVVQDQWPLVPVLTYLFHRIYGMLDGRPAILVLDEAWSLIDNDAFAPRIDAWLDKFRAKNAIIIFATESVETAQKSKITKMLSDKIETKIFLPNPKATEAYIDVFGLGEKELDLLKTMSAKRREFLLKHNIDAVIAKLNLENMDYELAVLSARQENLALMEGSIKDAGADPGKWLPLFRKRLLS